MSGIKHRRLPGGLTANRLIPNALTLLALCAGVTAIRLALMERWEFAAAAIVVAMILDILDGRIARLIGATSEFGAQLDSLADVINFGVSPALIVYLWTLNELGGLGWALALVFVMCCALRLARFNVALGDPDPVPWSDMFFTGVPTPGAAGLVLLPMVLSFELGGEILGSPALNGIMMLMAAALMVSKTPTFSSKRMKVPHKYLGLALIGVGAVAALLVSTPWVILGIAGVAYFVSIPLAALSYRRLEANTPSGKDADPDA